MKITILALLVVAVSVFLACKSAAPSNQAANANASPPASDAKWDAYVEQFLTDYFTAHPDVAVIAGKHEFDGKLPDWSEDGLNKETARLKAEREKASALKDADLDERQRFERDYLIAQIDKEVFWRETADQALFRSVARGMVGPGAINETRERRQLRHEMRGDGLPFDVDHRPDRL